MPKFTGQPGPGRPKGCKNKVPSSAKASLKAVMEEVAGSSVEDIRAAFVKGIKSRPPHSLRYLEVMAHYVDGKPAETVKLKGPAILPPIRLFLHKDGIEDESIKDASIE